MNRIINITVSAIALFIVFVGFYLLTPLIEIIRYNPEEDSLISYWAIRIVLGTLIQFAICYAVNRVRIGILYENKHLEDIGIFVTFVQLLYIAFFLVFMLVVEYLTEQLSFWNVVGIIFTTFLYNSGAVFGLYYAQEKHNRNINHNS